MRKREPRRDTWIIISVFTEWRQTQRCLQALNEDLDRDFTIVLVDHGPPQRKEEREEIIRTYPDLVYLRGDSSLWWAGAMNVGIRAAIDGGARRVMLLNNDCYVTPETVSVLKNHLLAIGEKGIVAPTQMDLENENVLWRGGGDCLLFGFPTFRIAKRAGKNLARTKLIGGGRGVLIPCSVFKEVGILDEHNFPHYYADHDFYFRCRKHKLPLFVAADAVVYVDPEKTTLASQYELLSIPEFIRTLTDRRSHRNIRDTTNLFKLHYPIKRLYLVGVWLNIARYFTLFTGKWLLRHSLALLGARSQRSKRSS